jgi:hypothetical protein
MTDDQITLLRVADITPEQHRLAARLLMHPSNKTKSPMQYDGEDALAWIVQLLAERDALRGLLKSLWFDTLREPDRHWHPDRDRIDAALAGEKA